MLMSKPMKEKCLLNKIYPNELCTKKTKKKPTKMKMNY